MPTLPPFPAVEVARLPEIHLHAQAIQRLPGHGFGQKQARKAAERKQGNQREDHDDLAGMAPERRYQLAADHPSVPGALPEAR